jgi:hypothetical protein
VNLLTIQVVVLGGEYDIFADLLIPEIQRVVDKNCMLKPKISASSQNRKEGLLGMFALARGHLFKSIAATEAK